MGDYGDIQIELKLVNHQKQPGTLKCSMQYVLWEQDLIGAPLAISMATIKSHKISADGKDKVQIRLLINDGTATTFHFTDNNPPGNAKAQRDRVKIHISKLIGRVQLKEKPDKVYEERKKILGSDPALLKLYKELVTTGMVLPEEFWSLRSNLIVSTHKQQDIGVAGNFLSELRPKSDGSNSISISINEEKKQIIFRTYPAVKAKFLELCPSTISEKEFWTEFFQSHYFHRDRFATSGKEKNIFEACDKDEAADVSSQGKSDFLVLDAIFDEQSIVLPESADQIDLALEKAKLKDKKRKQNLTQKEVNRMLIRRFNQHSSLVLKATDRIKRPGAPVKAASQVPTKQMKDEVVQLRRCNEDLVAPHETAGVPLELKRRELFLNSNESENEAALLAKLTEKQRKRCVDKYTEATRDYQPRINTTITDAQDDFPSVLIELMQEQRKRKARDDETRDADDEKVLCDALGKCRELLTHFWSCFPPKPEHAEKLHRMHANICAFDDNSLSPLERDYPTSTTLGEIRDMVAAARQKFAHYESRGKKR